MKIFTSYHAKAKALIEKGIYPISISVKFPRYSKIRYDQYLFLAPTYAMLKMDEEEYYEHFYKILSKLNPSAVYKDLEHMSQGKDVAILCYEADVNTCHRQKVGQWLEEKLSITVKEVIFDKPKPKVKKNQLNLF